MLALFLFYAIRNSDEIKRQAAMSSWADESEDPPASPRGGEGSGAGAYGGGGGGGPPKERPRLQVSEAVLFAPVPILTRRYLSCMCIVGRLVLSCALNHL